MFHLRLPFPPMACGGGGEMEGVLLSWCLGLRKDAAVVGMNRLTILVCSY